MAEIATLDQWRKKTLSIEITLPVPKKKITAAMEDYDFLSEALKLYYALLQANQNGYTIKKLDAAMKEISDFDLRLTSDVSGTTKFTTRYKMTFGWRSVKRLDGMQKQTGSQSESELLSRAVFVLWEAHEHMQLDGYILLGKPGEKPEVISAKDFYQD
jgi:hypothetical protein